MYSLIRTVSGFFLILIIFLSLKNNVHANNVCPSPYDTGSGIKTINLPTFQKDTTGKVKLLQKIIAALRFTKNARAREQQRVITIIRTVMADSMVATAADIKKLNAELSLQQNQHFDSLRALINNIIASQEKDTVLAPDETPAEPPAPIPETDVASLISKIIPILQQKEKEERNSEAQQKQLVAVRALYGRPHDKVDTLRLSDTLGVTYTITLGHKAHVIGVHPYWMNDKYLQYNFTALSTVSFYGYTTEKDIKAKNIPPAPLNIFNLAAAAGKSRMFTYYETDPAHIEALLKDEDAQFRCIDSLLPLLQQYQADGINIWFSQLSAKQRDAFSRFVTLLSNYFEHNGQQQYTITVTLPAYDDQSAYDLRALDPLTDHFLIDFTKASGTRAGALSPMKGDARRAIEPVMSRFLNLQIAPSKFILLLSYYGTQWKKSPTGGKDVFTRYVPFSEIRNKYPGDSSVIYDEDAVAAYIEEKDANGDVTSEIWFDNENTLDVKYDYILNNGLGGVAIWPLGADDGYGELWDELAYKFISIDTTFTDTIKLGPPTIVTSSWWTRVVNKVSHEMLTLKLLFTDPCQLEAEKDRDDSFFAYVTLFFFIIALLIGFFYAYNVRMTGMDWPWRKLVLRILIAWVLITAFFGIVTLFLNRDVPFGITHADVTNAKSKCVTIPMLDLLLIFTVGLLLGMLIMRILIRPLLSKNDKP
ncbi:glycosyl hydrolase family 18 protein [Chitinophaga filiformis]|uniref:Glycosyl hydrolase family 18 protein n=1 Tax=Chitinophaga filiformis TaxID=104663 RepID=A0ABY4HU45_CHIFI|nr:glycosyl hydrolase family 18 protein [Chitinophaga filiformis]UPK66988.1 glycosyl hydrolase family 18 protein [Chitinophaga filiformis]